MRVWDDRRNYIWGARDAGCDAWLWGSDVHSFKEVIFNNQERARRKPTLRKKVYYYLLEFNVSNLMKEFDYWNLS